LNFWSSTCRICRTYSAAPGNAVTTLSSTVSKQQKEICHEKIPTSKEEILSSITSDVVNNSDVTSRSKSLDFTNAKSILAEGSQSLPHIFYLTTNPSLDVQDEDLWKYVCIHIITYIVILCTCTRIFK